MKKKYKRIKKHFGLKSKISHTFSKYSLKKCILSLNNISKKLVAFFLVFNFILGTLILSYTKTIHYFFPHLICLTLNIIITLAIGSEYAHTILFLDNEILENAQESNTELRGNYIRFCQKAFHILNLILCIVVLSIFFWGIFSQRYIKLDLVGCYAVYMVSITVSISVIGYAEYLWLLWFLYRVSHCSSIPYNKTIPAYTPFLVEIGTVTKHAKWCFFIEGFLYVFEYFILIPNGNITLSYIKMPNNFSFFITWGVIFVVIIIAFPIIIYIQEYLLSTIVRNLKTQEIKFLSNVSDTLKMENSEEFSQKYICQWMINNLISSPDYPVKIQRLGPAILSAATFVLHIVNLIDQYPELIKLLIDRII